MGYININYWASKLFFSPFKTDGMFTKVRRLKIEKNCNLCKTTIGKGGYSYGDRYWVNLCPVCMEKNIDIIIEGTKELLKGYQEDKKDLIKNKQKYLNQNLISKI